MAQDSLLRCCVCGMRQAFPPWGDDEATPSYRLCHCCGTTFGLEDLRFVDVIKRRIAWVADGMNWMTSEEKPDGWDPKQQLAQIPEKWTLESLGLGPNDTWPPGLLENHDVRCVTSSTFKHGTESGWSPGSIDYEHFAAFSEIPTETQTNQFVDAVCNHHSWYKHLPLLPPGAQFVFFLNPHAGYVFDDSLPTHIKGNRQPPIELVSREQRNFAANDIPTKEYVDKFGTWDYVVLDESDNRNSNQVELSGFMREKTSLPKPFVENGTCFLTGFLKFSPAVANRVHREIDRSRLSVLSTKIASVFGAGSERYRTQALIDKLKGCNGDVAKLDRSVLKLLELESEDQKDKIRNTLRKFADYFESRRFLSAGEFKQRFRELVSQVANEGTTVFFEDQDECSVLCQETVGKRVFGLNGDSEYGWPANYQIETMTAADCTCGHRHHPIILDGERFLAGCIRLGEYHDIIKSLRAKDRVELDCVNDNEIASQFIHIERSKSWLEFYVTTVSWKGPHKPEKSTEQVLRIPAGSHDSVVDQKSREILQDPTYFGVCNFCNQRKPAGWMSSDNCCQTCAEKEFGIVH